MKTGVLITNGGPHSAESWADATVSHIIEIADSASGEYRGAAIKLQAAIFDVLLRHHSVIQSGEQQKLEQHGADRLSHDLDPEHHVSVDDVIAEIIKAASGTRWENAFATDQMRSQLQVLLSNHFRTSMHIERSWYADKNQDHVKAQAFRTAHNVGGIK